MPKKPLPTFYSTQARYTPFFFCCVCFSCTSSFFLDFCCFNSVYIGGVARTTSSLFNELRSTVFAPVAQAGIRRVARTTFKHLHDMDLSFHLNRCVLICYVRIWCAQCCQVALCVLALPYHVSRRAQKKPAIWGFCTAEVLSYCVLGTFCEVWKVRYQSQNLKICTKSQVEENFENVCALSRRRGVSPHICGSSRSRRWCCRSSDPSQMYNESW